MHEALILAKDLAHPYSLAMALDRASFPGQFRREGHAAHQWADTAVGIAAEHGFRRHAALGPILRGWAQSMAGQAVEGIPQIRQGMNAYRALGMAMEEPYFLALLAEAQASGGLIDEGLATLAEALVALPSGRNFFYKAELYRLQGELLWQRPGSDEHAVENCFQQALDIARRQQAKLIELRAAMSLGRLWSDIKGNGVRLGSSWRRSITSSRRVLVLRICRQPKRSSRRWCDARRRHGLGVTTAPGSLGMHR